MNEIIKGILMAVIANNVIKMVTGSGAKQGTDTGLQSLSFDMPNFSNQLLLNKNENNLQLTVDKEGNEYR
jgi:hypothetical protein